MKDLIDIVGYSVEVWGARQGDIYERELRAFCTRLAAAPYLGRKCEELGSGLRKLEHASHVVYYRVEESGILISRILHARMRSDPRRFPEEE